MQTTDVQAALAAAVEEVLETMCFSAVFSSSEAALPEATVPEPNDRSLLTARLRFEGNPSGEFQLAIPMGPARTVGSGFLGKDEAEISEEQTREVVCELANMFCGSALSRLEAGSIFRLSHPELLPSDSGPSFDPAGIARWFELESGGLTASFSFQQAL
jgi:hypothetical protein